MAENKTTPTKVAPADFLTTVPSNRQSEAAILIEIMQSISGEAPVMWGPSIIGFGSLHYKYDTGREGDTPRLGFSPRKASITIYFLEGFNNYGEQLKRLGKFKNSVSCLYINKLSDIDLGVLGGMLKMSYKSVTQPQAKPTTVEEYIAQIPMAARPKFDELRQIVKKVLPNAKEVLSYGVVGYKINDKRAKVFISGWKDHLGVYPIPKNQVLRQKLTPYIKGKGTLWFPLDNPLDHELLRDTVSGLAQQ
jgi:uncharacterized protein YdhG (YjbR/CyaY superfamily)